MPDSPEVKVRLTAEDQGLTAAIGQLRNELGKLQSEQVKTVATSQKTASAFKAITEQALTAVKLRLANIPGLGNFGSLLAIRAYEPVGKMLEESASGIESKFGVAAAAIGATGAALAALGAIAFSVTRHMMDLAQSIENTAAATGLSTKQVQEYTELAKEMDVDAGSLQMAFARIQTQLGEFITTGSAAGSGSQYFVRVMKEMGISLIDVHGKLRPVNDILGDFADKLSKIPDQGTRTAIEMAALGTRGKVLAQVMEEAAREGLSLRDALASIDKSGNVIPDSELANLMEAKRSWDDLMRSIRGATTELEGFIANVATHPGAAAKALAKSFILGPGAGAASFADALGSEKGGAVSTGSAADALAIGQIAAQNEKLNERLQVLRAGGEAQLQLKNAEAGYAAALKVHNAELAKQYSEEISQLRQIIALEAAKKEKHGASPLLDAAAKAELALSLKQQQDMLTVWKAGAAGREEVDKEEYEKGTLSLKAYFDRRRAEIEQETAKEIAVLKQERDQVQAAADLAGRQSAAKKTAAGSAKNPEEKSGLLGQADRLAAEQLSQLARVDEISARISAMEIESRTKITALDAEQFKAQTDNQQKILEFQKEIDDLQGKQTSGTRDEIALKVQEMNLVRDKVKDDAAAVAQIDKMIAQYTQLKTAADDFSRAEKSTQQELRSLEIQRADIEIRLKDGKISEREAERELTTLLAREIPLLRQKAELELKAALASGNKERIAEAQQEIQEIQKFNDGIKQQGTIWQQLQQQWNRIGTEIKTTLTGSFTNLFTQLMSGTESVGQAFAQLGISVVQSLEKIVAQMLATIVVQKLMEALGLGDNNSQAAAAKKVATAAAVIKADAGQSAADVFVQAIESIPFPANLAAAPALASFAHSEALATAGFAAKGALLPKDMLVQAHAKEMILPADISTGLRSAISTGSIARPSDLRMPSLNAPEFAAGAGSHVDNRTYSPQITVHQTNSKMSVEEISSAVRRGMRLGY
jgi:hypothetical protein